MAKDEINMTASERGKDWSEGSKKGEKEEM